MEGLDINKNLYEFLLPEGGIETLIYTPSRKKLYENQKELEKISDYYLKVGSFIEVIKKTLKEMYLNNALSNILFESQDFFIELSEKISLLQFLLTLVRECDNANTPKPAFLLFDINIDPVTEVVNKGVYTMLSTLKEAIDIFD